MLFLISNLVPKNFRETARITWGYRRKAKRTKNSLNFVVLPVYIFLLSNFSAGMAPSVGRFAVWRTAGSREEGPCWVEYPRVIHSQGGWGKPMVIHRVWEKLWINLWQNSHPFSCAYFNIGGNYSGKRQSYPQGAKLQLCNSGRQWQNCYFVCGGNLAAERRWCRCGVGATGVVGWGDGLLPISDLSGGYKHYLLLKRSLITDL